MLRCKECNQPEKVVKCPLCDAPICSYHTLECAECKNGSCYDCFDQYVINNGTMTINLCDNCAKKANLYQFKT